MKIYELFEARKSSNKSTRDLGTTRATSNDIKSALAFVSKHAGIPIDDLKANLLGSTPHTLAGQKTDSGDIDVAVDASKYNEDSIVKKMLDATGQGEIHRAGKGVFSFAVPVEGGNKVQVDLMLVPSTEWARWAFHSAPGSKYKGAVRSLLLVNMMKQVWEEGKDLEVDGEDGEPVIRVRRSFKADEGLERIFKVRPMRKDGKGRTKNLGKVTAKDVQAELDRMGLDHKFDPRADPIRDPNKAAQLMFGHGVKAKDILSVEQIVSLIKKRKDAKEIFQNTMNDLREQDLEVPPELEQYR
jgi:hypothetical protein